MVNTTEQWGSLEFEGRVYPVRTWEHRDRDYTLAPELLWDALKGEDDMPKSFGAEGIDNDVAIYVPWEVLYGTNAEVRKVALVLGLIDPDPCIPAEDELVDVEVMERGCVRYCTAYYQDGDWYEQGTNVEIRGTVKQLTKE